MRCVLTGQVRTVDYEAYRFAPITSLFYQRFTALSNFSDADSNVITVFYASENRAASLAGFIVATKNMHCIYQIFRYN